MSRDVSTTYCWSSSLTAGLKCVVIGHFFSLGQSFKPVEVTDKDESSFKVVEESVSAKGNKKGHDKVPGKSPLVITSPNQSGNPGLATLPEVHTTGNIKNRPTSTVHTVSHKSPAKTVPVPYHVQTHVVNLTDHRNSFHVIGLPIRLHAHPVLTLPDVNVSSSLSRQQTSDLHGNKASNIHNSGVFEWGAFSKCSVTCGEGVRKRSRKCTVQECTAPGIETQVVPCIASTCPGMLVFLSAKTN